MHKSIKIIPTFFASMLILTACINYKFVEYKPHYRDESGNRYNGDIELDSNEYENTIHVLKYYGEKYKTRDGNIVLISKDLADNWELLWNYTSKANNKKWLEAHALD